MANLGEERGTFGSGKVGDGASFFKMAERGEAEDDE